MERERVCCGGTSSIIYEEELVNVVQIAGRNVGNIDEEFMFPNIDEVKEGMESALSIPCLSVVTLGSTGWVGLKKSKVDPDRNNGYWYCTYDDLSADGKYLVEYLKGLYKDCPMVLLTWLDT